LPLLDGDWGQAFATVAKGEVPRLKWKPLACACVVLAAEGYPDAPKKGIKIEGEITSETPSSYFLHAGTRLGEGRQWITDGGRVLNAVGIGSNLKEAVQNAYAQSGKVRWPGMQLRKDIGHQLL
jgi:phosphoribosylamine---glycine ligase